MLALPALLACGFSAPLVRLGPASRITTAAVSMSDAGTNPLNGEPTTGLWDKMVFRGAGGALLFYLAEMREAFDGVDADADGYISADELGQLMRNVDSERSEEQIADMMAMIEQEQEIKKRDDEGAPLIFCEQWAKCMQDMVRKETTGSSQVGGGFKFPWS